MTPFTRALCRTPGADAASGLTTSSALGAPDHVRLLAQHAAYVDTLRGLGLTVDVLPPLPGFPDAYFVEDPVVFTPSVALVTRPGAAARLGEAEAIAPALAKYADKRVERVEAPATLDGGDVLCAGGHWFIGLSDRTNAEGAASLGKVLEAQGLRWTSVPVGAGLHLKSSVNSLGDSRVIVVPDFAEHPAFAALAKVVVDSAEEYAANTLWINGTLITPRGFPKTLAKLQALGMPVVELDTGEIRKMDGGLTCLSLRF
jgi:dimethylargininase